ncbi:MAG: YIP1 family protein [Acidobacteria bacterium]|nr:YIP1 family protein [Acidobacteriota bacterium]
MSEQPNPSLYGDEPAPATKPVAPGLMDQFIGVFTEPVTLFKRLAAAPSWAWAVGLGVALALTVSVIWGLRVDVDAMLRPILERNPQLSADQIDAAIGIQRKFILPFSVLGSLIGIPVITAIVALVYFLVGKGLSEGEPASFEHAMSAAAVPGLVMVPHSLGVLVMCMVREVGGATPDKLAPTALGFFLHAEAPKVQALFNLMDPFVIASWVMTWLATRHLMGMKVSGATLCTALVVLFGVGGRLLGAR